MAEERWLPVEGFRGYDVSDQGRVRSWLTSMGVMSQLRREPRVIKTHVNKQGEVCVKLATKFGKLERPVTGLVAAAFPSAPSAS